MVPKSQVSPRPPETASLRGRPRGSMLPEPEVTRGARARRTARELLAFVGRRRQQPRGERVADGEQLRDLALELPRQPVQRHARRSTSTTASTGSIALFAGVDVVERDRALADAAQPGGRREPHAGRLQPLDDEARLEAVDQARRQRRETGGDVSDLGAAARRAVRRCPALA